MKKEVIDAINDSPFKAYFAITGGGQTFIGDYLSVSGASKTVIGALVPYSQYAFDKFVGHKVASYASDEAARKLAVAAYNECVAAGVNSQCAIGLGAACSLAKDGERTGRVHKIFVCVHMRNRTYLYSAEFNQGSTRAEEEYSVSQLLLHVLNKMTVKVVGTHVPPFDKHKESYADGTVFSDVIETPCGIKLYKFDDEQDVVPVYPGSWNPMHEAHQEVYNMSQIILGARPLIELSITNPDKGQLDAIEVYRRMEQIDHDYPIAITNAPTFIKKALCFRNKFGLQRIVFIVGADTWKRIWDSKYAGPCEEVLQVFKANKVEFLVFGRNGIPVEQAYGEEIRIKDPMAENYNNSLSSTELRKA